MQKTEEIFTNIHGQNFKTVHIYMKYAECVKRMKNQFSNFYFLRYGRFFTHNWSIFRWILSKKLTITQNIN